MSATALDALNALQRLEQGTAMTKIYEAICEVSEAVLLSRFHNPSQKIHKGKVTFDLEIIHDREWDERQVVTRGAITKKTPKHEPRGAVFYSYEGSLFRENPVAEELPPFRAVDLPSDAARNIDPPDAATSREA